jgi:hypothetical protein
MIAVSSEKKEQGVGYNLSGSDISADVELIDI